MIRPLKVAEEDFRPLPLQFAAVGFRSNGASAPCTQISSAISEGRTDIIVASAHFPLEEPSLADKVVNSLLGLDNTSRSLPFHGTCGKAGYEVSLQEEE